MLRQVSLITIAITCLIAIVVTSQVPFKGCDEPGVLMVPCTNATNCIFGCYAKFYPPQQYEVCKQGTGYCARTSSNPQGLNKFCALQSSGQLKGWLQVECG